MITDAYKEDIRKKKNICVINIMKQYQEILYGRKKIVPTTKTKEYDKIMLKNIIDEVDKLINEII